MKKLSSVRIFQGPRCGAGRSLAVLAMLLSAGALAHAELVEIAWDAQGQFKHSATLKPGKMLEVCGRLSKDAVVNWRFSAGQPVDFNIHYHQGKQVVFPAKQEGVASADGILKAAVDQDYCWMWTSRSAEPAALELQLDR
ncbi:MAG: hypothetical protein RLZZ598_784 [Pseudomonadota bacterium]|jgi:hypothetical protein